MYEIGKHSIDSHVAIINLFQLATPNERPASLNHIMERNIFLKNILSMDYFPLKGNN